METPKDLRKEFPSTLDIAYAQYKRDLARHRKIEEIMTHEVVTIDPESTLDEAAKIMGEKHIGSLIVLKYDTPVGIITERDTFTQYDDCSNIIGDHLLCYARNSVRE